MRLTTNKPITEMTMLDQACNCVYTKDKNTYYRDYETDEPLLDFIIKLSEKLGGKITTAKLGNIELMEEELWDDLNYPLTEINGLMAFTYRNLVAIGELRERLKEYEDLEEQGKLINLPIKLGDTIYMLSEGFIEPCTVETIFIADYTDKKGKVSYMAEIHYDMEDCPYVSTEIFLTDIGKTVFLSEPEAEQALCAKVEQLEKSSDGGLEDKPIKQTNADRIRTMSDKELAEFLERFRFELGDIDYAVTFCDLCKEDGNELNLDCSGYLRHWLESGCDAE